MLPLLEPFNLRWLEEPVIPDDIRGYAELKSLGRIPIAGGEHEFTLFGFQQLLEARAGKIGQGGRQETVQPPAGMVLAGKRGVPIFQGVFCVRHAATL